MRPSQRQPEQMRAITITRQYTKHAEGSILIAFGETKVLCTASVENSVPRFLKDSGQGWVTAEYGMLPRSTHTRMEREASRGKQGGRTLEIQRLIGRSLRAAVDLNGLDGYTITVDCDVLQADGGTRTAAITGGCVALYDAVTYLREKAGLTVNPFKQWIAAISAGIYEGVPVLDLDYQEDSNADVDMNVVMTQGGELIEVQGTAEKVPFSKAHFYRLLELAEAGVKILVGEQKGVVGDH